MVVVFTSEEEDDDPVDVGGMTRESTRKLVVYRMAPPAFVVTACGAPMEHLPCIHSLRNYFGQKKDAP